MAFPSAPVLFIDEAQDLSSINRRMIRQIVGFGTRLIAVGDEAQAIYGFRGADHDSMEQLSEQFKMARHKLTITFRCSQSGHAPCELAPGRHEASPGRARRQGRAYGEHQLC